MNCIAHSEITGPARTECEQASKQASRPSHTSRRGAAIVLTADFNGPKSYLPVHLRLSLCELKNVKVEKVAIFGLDT